MWFGDLVTMRWFNDVWMKEVFANFMAAKIVNPSFPKVNHELRFLVAHYPAAYAVDRTAGHASDPPGARQPERGRQPLRRHHLSEGADRDAAARAPARRRRAARRPARVPEAVRVRQRDAGSISSRCSTSGPIAIWRPGAGSGSKRPAGRRSAPSWTPMPEGRVRQLAFVQSDPQATASLRVDRADRGAARARRPARAPCRSRSADERTEVPDAAALSGRRFVLPTGGGLAYGGFDARRSQPVRICWRTSRSSRIRSRAARRGSRCGRSCSTGRVAAAGVCSTPRCARCRARTPSRTCSSCSAIWTSASGVPAGRRRAARPRAELERTLARGHRARGARRA